MLKRLIENWLTSISEREFDIPFRLLLEAEGHLAIGHSTVHGPMELGKDIVSHHPSEDKFYFFQLKAGDAKLSDWNNMERQIRQLVEVPYTHPNYTIGSPYQPVWVCTGQLEETVRLSLGGKNEEHRIIGKPPIEVWERNILIEKYVDAFFDVVFVDNYFLVDFMRVWSHARDYLTDEDNLRAFFHQYLLSCPLDSEPKIARYLAAYVLMLAQLGQRYVSVGDTYSGIDCLVLGTVQLYEFVVINDIQEKTYINSHTALMELINFHLQNLVDGCLDYKHIAHDLLETTPGTLDSSEIFELPLRVHSLASKIALLLLIKTSHGENITDEAELLQIVITNNNAAFCNVISERQMGTFWVSLLGLLNSERLDIAERCVASTFDWLLSFHGKENRRGLPDPYQTFKIVPYHHLGVEPDNDRLVNMNGQSYFLPILLSFLCHLGLRDCVARQWKLLSHMLIREYQPANIGDLFSYRSDGGMTITIRFPVTGSWHNIQEHFSQRLPSHLAALFDKHPESLLFLTLAYPWRTQWREVDRFL